MRIFKKLALTKIFLLTISIFFSNVFIVAEESNLYLDLSKIGPIAPKGRIQDKEYNPDLPIIDELIRIGPASIVCENQKRNFEHAMYLIFKYLFPK